MNEEEKNHWLSSSSTNEQLDAMVNSKTTVHLQSHPIAKELFKMNIFYKGILEPVNYSR